MAPTHCLRAPSTLLREGVVLQSMQHDGWVLCCLRAQHIHHLPTSINMNGRRWGRWRRWRRFGPAGAGDRCTSTRRNLWCAPGPVLGKESPGPRYIVRVSTRVCHHSHTTNSQRAPYSAESGTPETVSGPFYSITFCQQATVARKLCNPPQRPPSVCRAHLDRHDPPTRAQETWCRPASCWVERHLMTRPATSGKQ